MKKALFALGLLWSAVANAQFTPGQLLTAGELNAQFALYAPLAGATFTGPVSVPNLSASGTVSGVGFANLLAPYALLSGATFTGGISATGITSTPISGSTGSFTTLSASSTVTLPAGSLPLTDLATQAANTIVANGTGSTASPTAIAAPSCSTPSSALQWTSGAGLACNSAINAATLGGATFASPGSIGSSTAGSGAFTTLSASSTVSGTGFTNLFASPPAIGSTTASTGAFTNLSSSGTVSGTGFSNYLASPPAIGGTAAAAGSFTTLSSTGAFTPSQTNGIVGTTTNNNANAGSVGEVMTNQSVGISLTSAAATTTTNITLTAGDWDVSGSVQYVAAGGAAITFQGQSLSTTTNVAGAFPQVNISQATQATNATTSASTPVVRFSLSSSTTVYLIAQATFGSGTVTATGFIRARRVR